MSEIRHNWQQAEVAALFKMPFMELLFQAHSVHRKHFDVNTLQLASLLSIKTGSCPEDCAYCPQSAHHKTNIEKHRLMSLEAILEKAKAAKASGATATTRINSKEANFAVFSNGIPGKRISKFMGTLSGCSGKLASCIKKLMRSMDSSPMPIMPPQQTLMPAVRTRCNVSNLS